MVGDLLFSFGRPLDDDRGSMSLTERPSLGFTPTSTKRGCDGVTDKAAALISTSPQKSSICICLSTV